MLGSAQTINSQGAESAWMEALVGLGARDPAWPQETDLLLVLSPLLGCGGQLPAGPSPALYLCRVSQALQKQSSQEACCFAWTSPREFGEHAGSVTEGLIQRGTVREEAQETSPGAAQRGDFRSTSS